MAFRDFQWGLRSEIMSKRKRKSQKRGRAIPLFCRVSRPPRNKFEMPTQSCQKVPRTMRYTKQEKTERIATYLRVADILPPGPYRLYGILQLLEFVKDECDDIMTPTLHRAILDKAIMIMAHIEQTRPPMAEGVPTDLAERLMNVCLRIQCN